MNEVLSGPGSHACTSVVHMSDRGGVTGLWSLAGHACEVVRSTRLSQVDRGPHEWPAGL